MAKSLSELVAEIVLTQSQRRDLDADEITRLSLQTAQAFKLIQQVERGGEFPPELNLQSTQSAPPFSQTPAAEESKKPTMNPLESIKKDAIICLECGTAFKQISYKHLQSHGLTPAEYREKYGFSKRQALTAKSVSEQRGERMKQSGLVAKMQEGRRSKTTESESQ
jgi:predicted transcriptional regulator